MIDLARGWTFMDIFARDTLDAARVDGRVAGDAVKDDVLFSAVDDSVWVAVLVAKDPPTVCKAPARIVVLSTEMPPLTSIVSPSWSVMPLAGGITVIRMLRVRCLENQTSKAKSCDDHST
ncbi:hypothetical protein ABIF53_004071 [Bradyrhizobium japonicum]